MILKPYCLFSLLRLKSDTLQTWLRGHQDRDQKIRNLVSKEGKIREKKIWDFVGWEKFMEGNKIRDFVAGRKNAVGKVHSGKVYLGKTRGPLKLYSKESCLIWVEFNMKITGF